MGILSNVFSSLEDSNNPLLGPNLWGLSSSFMLDNNKQSRRLFFCIHMIAMLFNLTHYIELWRIRSDYESALRNISRTLPNLLCLVKAWTFIAWHKHWKSIFEFISTVEKEQASENNKAIKPIISTYISYSRKVTYYYWYLMNTTIIAIILGPFVGYFTSQTQRELIKNGSIPYPEILSSWMPFDRTQGLGYWAAIVVHSIAIIYGCAIVANYDTNAVAIMTFFKGQLEIISLQCSQIFNDENGRFNKMEAKENIRKCHIHYINLVKYAKKLNSLLSPVMFLYMIICSLMICASAIQLNAEGTTNFQRLWILEYLFALVFQLFLYCWHSNEVLYMSTKVDDGVYCASWWARGSEERRSAILLQGQLRKNILFTPGPFTQLTVSTFVAIIKGSYSYYTLLGKTNE